MLLLRHRLSAIYIVEHGTYHIGINGKLLLQGFDAVETVFVAHAAVKAEFEMVAVKVAAVIVEQVGLDGLVAAIVECRPPTYVDHGFIAETVYFGPCGINTASGHKLFGTIGTEVG